MRTFLIIAEIILAIIVVVSIMMQPSKADALSGFIQGKGDTFYSKNKGRTKEAMLVKTTIISTILFVIVTIGLNMVK
ncbi:preprotein translocase subunit SecG [Clostridium massiliamazoniense]|uniref:preprotein translocase subunit SecG n=1 Tax=Clostridium massiliamazoniense TaxID=1347366 RepID=UPI0006D826A5|nr:preprotein translocase subunit SecG [Clostridium massiliamazoniense]